MLEHLVSLDLEPAVRETTAQERVRVSRTQGHVLLDAQNKTADWLEELGLTEAQVLPQIQQESAQRAFGAMVTGQSDEQQVQALTDLEMPEAVRHVTGMLTAYDWEFVTEAKRIRNFVVTRLMEEATRGGKPADTIKALTALGKITEIGLFTEKIEVKKIEQTDEELDVRIKERLAKLRGVVDAISHAPRELEDLEVKRGPDDAQPG